MPPSGCVASLNSVNRYQPALRPPFSGSFENVIALVMYDGPSLPNQTCGICLSSAMFSAPLMMTSLQGAWARSTIFGAIQRDGSPSTAAWCSLASRQSR